MKIIQQVSPSPTPYFLDQLRSKRFYVSTGADPIVVYKLNSEYALRLSKFSAPIELPISQFVSCSFVPCSLSELRFQVEDL